VNARKKSKYKNRTALAFTPGYVVTRIVLFPLPHIAHNVNARKYLKIE